MWMRRLGADALVFPSARSNVRLRIQDGAIQECYGWNLVDYRGAPFANRMSVCFTDWPKTPMRPSNYMIHGEQADPSIEFLGVRIDIEAVSAATTTLNVDHSEALQDALQHVDAWRFFVNRLSHRLSRDDVSSLEAFPFNIAARSPSGEWLAGLSETDRVGAYQLGSIVFEQIEGRMIRMMTGREPAS
jgi:hypothetical protein